MGTDSGHDPNGLEIKADSRVLLKSSFSGWIAL